MSNYVDLGAVSGYIIDPAYLIFERQDGKTFLLCNGTSGSVDTTQESITISNGWITSPRAVIDTTTEDTIQYTSNLTDLWSIAGVNNLVLKHEATDVTMGDYYMVYEVPVDGGEATEGTFTIESETKEVIIEGPFINHLSFFTLYLLRSTIGITLLSGLSLFLSSFCSGLFCLINKSVSIFLIRPISFCVPSPSI